MSKEISLFRDEKDVVVANAADGLDDVTKRLLGNADTTYKRISLKGGKFRMIVNGEQVAVSPSTSLDVVIVNAGEVSRYWYAKDYDPGTTGAPDCFSNDGKRPDPKSVSPQGNTCENCPRNVKGPGNSGRRQCKFARRLAVVLANDIGNSDVYQLQLSPGSMFSKEKNTPEDRMPLDTYVKTLAARNYSITNVVTEMRFDQEADYAKLFFRPVRRLTEDEKVTLADKRESIEAKSAITFSPGHMDTAAPKAIAAPTAPVEKKVEVVEEEPSVRQSKAKSAPVGVAVQDGNTLMTDWATSDDD